MAENIMRRYFGATTPSWMNETTAAASTFGASYSDSESVAQVSHSLFLEEVSDGRSACAFPCIFGILG